MNSSILAIQLAYKNLLGAGLRTWLNVIVLSFSFVVIVWVKGIMAGWDYQAKTDMTHWEIAHGQLWHQAYDPYDFFSLQDAHDTIPHELKSLIAKNDMVPLLFAQASLFPQGRMLPIVIKGIPAHQRVLAIPSKALDTIVDALPAIIGSSMAHASNLQHGDYVTIRWRDAQGTFDARTIYIAYVFSTNVPSVDARQIWVELDSLQAMLSLQGHATLFSYIAFDAVLPEHSIWIHKSYAELTADVEKMVQTKSAGQSIFYIVLLLLAMLAIFDTQVLSVFKRQKEIGTYIALGFTRRQVVWLFTIEGTMHAILATCMAAVYGIPFLWWQAYHGFTLPVDSKEYGIAIADVLYPVFSVGLVFSTICIVVLTTAIVSYLPSKKISRMKPTDALRGKLQ